MTENTQTYGKNIMLAGACAGIAEHSIMFPIDLVKTRLQSMAKIEAYKSATDAVRKIRGNEGIRGLTRGLNIIVLSTGPAHALHFSAYEFLKSNLKTQTLCSNFGTNFAVAGGCAAFMHDLLMNPAEVVKQRMQMKNSTYRKTFECLQSIYFKEGLVGFYRSLPLSFSMNLPNALIHFPIYEFSLHILQQSFEPTFVHNLIAGSIAGGLSAGLTTPLDVIRTLINTQEQSVRENKGILTIRNSAFAIYEYKGIMGFWRGLWPRMLYAIPSSGICWSTYEILKNFLALPNEPFFD